MRDSKNPRVTVETSLNTRAPHLPHFRFPTHTPYLRSRDNFVVSQGYMGLSNGIQFDVSLLRVPLLFQLNFFHFIRFYSRQQQRRQILYRSETLFFVFEQVKFKTRFAISPKYLRKKYLKKIVRLLYHHMLLVR